MLENDFFVPMDGKGGYINVPIYSELNNNVYYDRKHDTQGIVPGLSYEQTLKEFEKKYNQKL